VEVELWTLRYKTPGQLAHVGERTFPTENTFILALQTAYREDATDIVATLPDGQVLTENAVRRRYPPR
jgi:hypothetical protein